MHTHTYDTNLVLSGPFRMPAQMLEHQEYDGHKSLHDGDVAAGLGIKGAPIEGPTHFSQFVPLLVKIWGNEWYEKGCFSSHFLNMVIEGEKVKAFVEIPEVGATITKCWAEKEDGTPVLQATASLGKSDETILEMRMAKLRPINRLVILEDLDLGWTSPNEELVIMKPNQHMGNLYPFTLNQKLTAITEKTAYYSDAAASPWGKAIIPLEMVSVLAAYSSGTNPLPIKQPVIGLFADLEIRMVNGPLLVDETYSLKREVVAIGESRKTEGFWTMTKIYDKKGITLKAEVLLHQAFFKESYPDYPKS